MANLKETIVESMIKDLANIKDFEEGKNLRKECSLLLKRIESAKKLFVDDYEMISKLNEIEMTTNNLKA